MKNNRERWQFYSHPSKPILTSQEVRYWKESLKKLLKVGIEFEFNLPEQKGSCRGDNAQCPCIHLDDGCWQECSLISKCRKELCYDTCNNRVPKCDPDNCAECKAHNFRCIGISCVDFVSNCFICNKFNKNCDTCSKKYNDEKDPAHIRRLLTQDLQPSKSYGKVSRSGVVGVTVDGSLLGDKGVEIITVGRRIDFWEFYNMSKKIIDKVTAMGGYLNERTGVHMHVLASYYEEGGSINELEKDMPQLILANFHQLCRRYQNALTWMTMALGDPNHMTRWEKFRVSILGISPVTRDMRHVMEEVAGNSGGNKYGFVNYNKCRFNKSSISRFHIEFREPDSTLCPSWFAALACIHYALVIKAVEISRYGLLKVGDEAWLNKAIRMKEVILNGKGNWDEHRTSDTSDLLEHVDYFVQESLDLVGQLKGILLKMEPAYDISIKLAERPVSLRLIDGNTWEDIENELAVKLDETDQLELKLSEVIDLKLIEDCSDVDEWATEVKKCLDRDKDIDLEAKEAQIKSFVENKMREGDMIWSTSAGCVVAI